ncbi:hypothetical protein ACFL4U_01520 [Candidatus Neomarinimicrobiota bacterium]
MMKVWKRKQLRSVPRYADAMRDEAFDVYCTGLSRRRVAAVLQEKYGVINAPHANTVKRWMSEDYWTDRREKIRRRSMGLEDRQRALEGMRMLRGLEAVPYKSKGEAVRTLVQGQKVVRELGEEQETTISLEDIGKFMERYWDVLYTDEEVGPVLKRRQEIIGAKLKKIGDEWE